MILIADSGSTKTHWVLLNENTVVQQIHSKGINPFITSSLEIEKILIEEVLVNIDKGKVSTIVFYGAGCSTTESKKLIFESIQSVFPNTSQITIEHDLLAAARAACGSQQGIAVILGTGSNSCLFNGKEIVEHVNSLGFILGDEGSGAAIGKKWIAHYLYATAPKELAAAFDLAFNLSMNDIFNRIYKEPAANAYLASYAKFIHANIDHPFMNNLVIESFNDFFTNHVSKYTNYNKLPINAIGSVAFYFKNQLDEIAQKYGCILASVTKEPIQGLINFHLSWKE